MGGDGSIPGGSRLRDTSCLTATPSAASRPPPPLYSVTSRLLDLYCECVDNCGWARVLYDARGGMEKSTFIRKTELTPAPTVTALLTSMDSNYARRRAHDKQRTKTWAERRQNCSQPCLLTHSTEIDDTRGQPAPSSPSSLLRPSHLHNLFHPSQHRRHRLCRLHRLCRHSRHPCRGNGTKLIAKLLVPAVVLQFWPKKRPILQIDGCCFQCCEENDHC
jgi:hypothetical protein